MARACISYNAIYTSLNTDETNLSFDMNIIELRYHLIPQRGYVGSSTPSSVTIFLSSEISMLFDIKKKFILVNSNPILSLCSEDIVAHEVLSSLVLYLKHYQIFSVDFRIYTVDPR